MTAFPKLTQHPYHGEEDAGVIVMTSPTGKNLGEWHYHNEDERRAMMRQAKDIVDAIGRLAQ